MEFFQISKFVNALLACHSIDRKMAYIDGVTTCFVWIIVNASMVP